MPGRQERIEIFEGTRDLCLRNAYLQSAICSSRKNQRIYWEGDCIEYGQPRFAAPADMLLSPRKTVEAARTHKTICETVAGCRVTSIGKDAFPAGSGLSLSIPASVTEIHSLPEDFLVEVWDRPRFDTRENAMGTDEPVLITRHYSPEMIVPSDSYAERYC